MRGLRRAAIAAAIAAVANVAKKTGVSSDIVYVDAAGRTTTSTAAAARNQGERITCRANAYVATASAIEITTFRWTAVRTPEPRWSANAMSTATSGVQYPKA